MKLIVIYPGRFQPFGPHHFKSYQWLTKTFGRENVFIASSNHTDLDSPLTFKEKELCISKYDINLENVVQVKNPYKAEEITSKFNPNETAVIFAYGEKDFGRIQFIKKDGTPGYIQEYYGQKNLKPLNQCGYALELPHVSLQSTGKEVSGTWLRETLPLATRAEFARIMGYYDEAIHFMFKQRFHPDINELFETFFGEKPETKKSSNSPILTMEQSREVFQAINSNAGKYSKHIIHPFEDETLTDEELLEFVSDVLTKPETCSCSLKLDGHNFQVTYKNGQVLASRNKGTIVNPMTVDEVFLKYQGKDDIQFTFTTAHKAIEEHLLTLSHETLTEIFNNGRTFLNFEIIHPRARNVFEYGDKPFLSLHSLITYDEKGNEISRTKEIPDYFESQPRNGFEIKITPSFQLKPNPPESVQFFTGRFNHLDRRLFVAGFGNDIIRQFCKETKQNPLNKTTQVKIITKTRTLCKTEKDKSDFKLAYENLQRVGGIDSLNPIEGLVVEWRGRQYKLTGSFLLCVPIFRIYNQDRYKKV